MRLRDMRLLQLLAARVILRAQHEVLASLHLLPLQIGHLHEMRRSDAVLLRWPDLEDCVLIGELDEVEPLDGHTVCETLEIKQCCSIGRALWAARAAVESWV